MQQPYLQLVCSTKVLRVSHGLHSVHIFILHNNIFANKLSSYRGDSPAQHYNELILGVTEAAPAALIVPVEVIAVELGNKRLFIKV